MEDGQSTHKRSRRQKRVRKSQFLILRYDHESQSCKVALGIGALPLRELPEVLRIGLEPVFQLMIQRGWQKLELATATEDDSFADDRKTTFKILSSPEVVETVKGVIWHIKCLGRYDAKRSLVKTLSSRIYHTDREIAELEAQIEAVRQRRDGLQTQMNGLILEAAELSAGLESVMGVPSHHERDRESARPPRGRHRKVRAAK